MDYSGWGSLDCILDRADKLETDLRGEKEARRRERADGHLRRFADLVGYNARIRRIELHLGAGLRSSGGAEVSTDAQNGTSEGELGPAGDDGADSDDSHQSRLERVAQHTIGSAPSADAAPAYADPVADANQPAAAPADASRSVSQRFLDSIDPD